MFLNKTLFIWSHIFLDYCQLSIKLGSEAHDGLCKVISDPVLLEDLEHCTCQVNTTLLEVFHSAKIRYLPKQVYFRMEKMIAGTQIAALDHNHSVSREQVKLAN